MLFFIIERPMMFNVPDISNITSITNATRITLQGYAKGLLKLICFLLNVVFTIFICLQPILLLYHLILKNSQQCQWLPFVKASKFFLNI